MKESEILSAKIKRDIKEQEKTQEFGSNLNGSLALIQAWKLGGLGKEEMEAAPWTS